MVREQGRLAPVRPAEDRRSEPPERPAIPCLPTVDGGSYTGNPDPSSRLHWSDRRSETKEAASVARPLGIFVVGLGLALFGIAAAGLIFQLFAAPAEEPVAGVFAAYPVVEAVFISGLFALIGLGAVLFPLALNSFSSHGKLTPIVRVVGSIWLVTGIVFLLFGAMNFYTHIGLIVKSMQ